MEYKVAIYIIFFIGVLFLLHFFYLFILSKRTSKWLSVESIIDTSELEVINQGIGNDNSVLYKANVKYQYMIEGKLYSSKRIFIGDFIRNNFSHSAEGLIDKYSKGETILVYYNPQHPNKSVLKTGVHTVIYRELFVAILFLLPTVIV